MKLYNFERLIEKYSVPLSVTLPPKERYEHGRLVREDDFDIEMHGAVIPMTQRKIYQSGGYYTSSDRQLYMKKPIADSLDGVKVMHKNKVYKVEEDTDYSDYADVYVYVLKWVSNFDKP